MLEVGFSYSIKHDKIFETFTIFILLKNNIVKNIEKYQFFIII